MRLLPLLLVACVTACSLAPSRDDAPPPPMPTQWSTAAGAADAAPIAADWWRAFGSDELDALMREALASNHDLSAARHRIEQARAQSTLAHAPLLPSVGASASAGRQRSEDDAGARSTSTGSTAAVTVSWELDLFGANRAGARAARAREAAAVFDAVATELALQADVADDYFEVLALRDRLRIARENQAAAQQLLDLVQVRYDNGAATALEIAQQKTTLLNFQASIPSLGQSLQEALHALALLLGRAPQGFTVAGATLDGVGVPAIAPGLPSTLVARRPDLRATESQLEAAGADVAAARAALFPAIDLSASAGIAGWLSGGATTMASMAASLAQTLFEGGARRARVALTQAQRAELVDDYASAILGALRDVEDSLVAAQASAERLDLFTQTVAQAREANRLALLRYREGAADLLELLDSQRQLLNAQDALVQDQLARHVAAVNLVKALGGGWDEP